MFLRIWYNIIIKVHVVHYNYNYSFTDDEEDKSNDIILLDSSDEGKNKKKDGTQYFVYVD